jgi:hypothetical protein
MAVTFAADQCARLSRGLFIETLSRAIADVRPHGEDWHVRILEPATAAITRFEFRRGTEAAKSLTLVLQNESAMRNVLYAAATQLLRQAGPGASMTRELPRPLLQTVAIPGAARRAVPASSLR